MAKMKAKAAKKKPALPSREESVRFRMSTAFKAWLERYADSRQLTVTDTIAQGVIAMAKADGFELPPRR